MKKHLLSLILVWSVMLLPAGAQTPAELQGEARKAAIDAILKANDIKTSLRFDFELRRHSSLLTEDLVSSGQASYVYPDKVRWEVRRPQPNVFVLNGTSTTDRRRQTLLRNVSKISERGLINETDFDITVFSAPGQWQVDLIPLRRDLGQLFECITLLADPATGALRGVVLSEVGGDTSYLKLHSVEKGIPLADELFVQP